MAIKLKILPQMPPVIGPVGPQGPQGIQGVQGTPGEKWFMDVGNPGVVPGAIDGDIYLDTSDGDVFELVGGVWTLRGNIRGPQGIQGIQGIQGPPGVDGSGTPASAIPLMDATPGVVGVSV